MPKAARRNIEMVPMCLLRLFWDTVITAIDQTLRDIDQTVRDRRRPAVEIDVCFLSLDDLKKSGRNIEQL